MLRVPPGSNMNTQSLFLDKVNSMNPSCDRCPFFDVRCAGSGLQQRPVEVVQLEAYQSTEKQYPVVMSRSG